jgi:hypothetical protein
MAGRLPDKSDDQPPNERTAYMATHLITGDLLGALHFVPAIADEPRRMMTTGRRDANVMAFDTLAQLLAGGIAFVDAVSEEVNRLADAIIADAAAAELVRRGAHPRVEDPAEPTCDPACEYWLDVSAAGHDHHTAEDILLRQPDAMLFALACDVHERLRDRATAELGRRGYSASRISAHVQAGSEVTA